MMKKGINRWCFPADLPLRKVMELTSKAGFSGLELNMEEETQNNDELYNLNLNYDSQQLQQIKELSAENDLEIPSISSGLFWNYSLTAPQKKVRKQARKIVRKMIDSAVELGADTILVVPGMVNEDVSYKTAYSRALDQFKELKHEAEKREINIGIENVWNRFLLSPLEMRDFILEIDSPRVGAYFDVGNVVDFSYPEYWIEVLGAKICKVHIKDYKTEVGTIHGFTNLLQGDVNWSRVMSALRETGYDDYLTAELSPYKDFPGQLALETATAMEKIISL